MQTQYTVKCFPLLNNSLHVELQLVDQTLKISTRRLRVRQRYTVRVLGILRGVGTGKERFWRAIGVLTQSLQTGSSCPLHCSAEAYRCWGHAWSICMKNLDAKRAEIASTWMTLIHFLQQRSCRIHHAHPAAGRFQRPKITLGHVRIQRVETFTCCSDDALSPRLGARPFSSCLIWFAISRTLQSARLWTLRPCT